MMRRGCFECGSPHLASECPKKKQFHVRAASSQLEIAEEEKGIKWEADAMTTQYKEDIDETIIRAGAIRARPICLNARLNNTSNLFLQVQINGYTCEAMIDNGATHNFITPVCARKFGLKLQPLRNLAINFVQGFTDTCSIIEDVKVIAGDWKGQTTFLSLDMDNFDVFWGWNGWTGMSSPSLEKK